MLFSRPMELCSFALLCCNSILKQITTTASITMMAFLNQKLRYDCIHQIIHLHCHKQRHHEWFSHSLDFLFMLHPFSIVFGLSSGFSISMFDSPMTSGTFLSHLTYPALVFHLFSFCTRRDLICCCLCALSCLSPPWTFSCLA